MKNSLFSSVRESSHSMATSVATTIEKELVTEKSKVVVVAVVVVAAFEVVVVIDVVVVISSAHIRL